MFSFYFPGTAAILLRTHTWLSDVAITNALRNYGRDRQQWWIKSRQPGNHHYHFIPADGGWRITAGPLSNPFVEPPF
jgi:hypothetical protein